MVGMGYPQKESSGRAQPDHWQHRAHPVVTRKTEFCALMSLAVIVAVLAVLCLL